MLFKAYGRTIAPSSGGQRTRFTKTLLVMKLTLILLTAAALQVSARSSAQSVTFTGRDVSLKEVFTAIKQQTGYVVLFDYDMLKDSRPVTVTTDHLPLADFLAEVLKGQKLDFSIRRKTIFIKKAPAVAENVSPAGDLAPKPIHGVVRNEKGEPIANANIVVKGTSKGTSAAADGSFTIEAGEGDILLVSSVGYALFQYKITKAVFTSGTQLVIKLARSVAELEEVAVTVNTGYQKIHPEQSTGAVSMINTKEYEARVSTNFLDGLVNRLPGLMINNSVTLTTTAPGAGTTSRSLFNIRGISTMSANQNPLIVVDGYPTELTLDMIDPNEVKSVTILKDAAAATVYGVRASNGVIVIERKQAKEGKPRFSFRATSSITPKENYNRYRWEDNPSSIALMYQKDLYGKSVNASTWGSMQTTTTKSYLTPVYWILAQQAANVITPDQAAKAYADLQNYDNIDDYSRLFQRSALTQSYNLNVSGGSPNALYYITGNYTGNRLSSIENNNNRFLLSGRSTLRLSQRLSLELTTDYNEQRYNSAPVPSISSVNPYEHFQDASGNPAYIASGSLINPFFNNVLVSQGLESTLSYPLIDVNEISDKTRTVNNRITANFTYRIGGGFDLAFGGIYETSRSDIQHYASGVSSEAKQYIADYTATNTDGTLKFNIPKGGFLRQTNANTSSYTVRAQLNFNKRIANDHSFNAILGAEVRDLINKSSISSAFGYNDQTLLQQPVDYAGITNGTLKGTFGLYSPWQNNYESLFAQQYNEDRFLSGYANVVYSYKNTYSITGSARIDQSNLFGTNPKYKYKPLWSVGAAWNIDKERFMQGIDWLKQLKLRASYGFNGNVAKMSLPQVIAQYVISTYTSPNSTALKLYSSNNSYSYANSSLRWEQTKNANIGIDYRIQKSITGSIDYYQKTSTDLLGNAQIDPTIGMSPTIINKASIRNQGIEISLHADWISTKKFNWNTGLVIARNTSKTLDVYQRVDYNPQTLNSIGYIKGYPVGAMYSYRYGGLDTAGYPVVLNTKGTPYSSISTSTSSPLAIAMKSDTSGIVTYSGSSIPTINAGLSNRFDYGNFYLFLMVNYYGGFKVRVPRPNPAVTRPLEGAGTYWKKKGDELNTDVMALAAYSAYNSINPYNFADRYVVSGDYITLGDLTLSYSLDDMRVIKKAGFSHFEVKAQASNLLTVGLNKYNYSMATGSYQKSYVTPTYTFGIFTNF